MDSIKISKRRKLEGLIIHDGFEHPEFEQIYFCSKDGEMFWLHESDVPEQHLAAYLNKSGLECDGKIKKAKFYFEQKFKSAGN